MSWFEVQSPKRAAKIRLDASFFVIGRGERIAVFHDDPSISREHAAVVVAKGGGVRVRDLGSRNGVLLNGKPIGRYAETDVAFGDKLTIGATTLVLREGEPPPKVAVAAPAPVPATPASTETDPGAKLGSQTRSLDELASGLAEEREKLEALKKAPPSAAASAVQAALSAAQAAASAAIAANAAAAATTGDDVEDLSETQERDGGEPPPELLSSDEDELPTELA
jgi:pSer/pThr/pTyr-binding forkhead associated (FHA) protein